MIIMQQLREKVDANNKRILFRSFQILQSLKDFSDKKEEILDKFEQEINISMC